MGLYKRAKKNSTFDSSTSFQTSLICNCQQSTKIKWSLGYRCWYELSYKLRRVTEIWFNKECLLLARTISLWTGTREWKQQNPVRSMDWGGDQIAVNVLGCTFVSEDDRDGLICRVLLRELGALACTFEVDLTATRLVIVSLQILVSEIFSSSNHYPRNTAKTPSQH